MKGSPDQTPTLVSQGGLTLLILEGTRSTNAADPYRSGCIVGDLLKPGGRVTYGVSDVGDPVAGARVRVDGKKGKTGKNGQVTFQFPRGSRAGSFRVKASMANYLSAYTSLQIT